MADTSSDTPDELTLFRIGSITKLFTSLQTLILRHTSKLASLDDDIRTYYPDFHIQNPFSTNGVVTFRQLMSHMSGLPRDIPCMDISRKGAHLATQRSNSILPRSGLCILLGHSQHTPILVLGFSERSLRRSLKLLPGMNC